MPTRTKPSPEQKRRWNQAYRQRQREGYVPRTEKATARATTLKLEAQRREEEQMDRRAAEWLCRQDGGGATE